MTTSTFVAEMAPRCTRLLRSVKPGTPSRLSLLTNSPKGAPASTSAPNVISPLIPEKQSKWRCALTPSFRSSYVTIPVRWDAPSRHDEENVPSFHRRDMVDVLVVKVAHLTQRSLGTAMMSAH